LQEIVVRHPFALFPKKLVVFLHLCNFTSIQTQRNKVLLAEEAETGIEKIMVVIVNIVSVS
jgi:hypothetical protein